MQRCSGVGGIAWKKTDFQFWRQFGLGPAMKLLIKVLGLLSIFILKSSCVTN